MLVNYEEARKGRSVADDAGSKAWPGIPAGVEITIRPAGGGDPVAIKSGEGSTEYATLKRIGSRYGKIEVAVAGDYTVTVVPFTAPRELFEPCVVLKG